MRTARVRGPGHPDQACDLVAAAIIEEYIRRDSASRLDVRVSGGRGALFVAGEVISTADFDVSSVVRRALGGIGSAGTIEPFIAFEPLSPHMAPVLGSRDLVHVTAYATDETPIFVPRPVAHAREIARELERRRIHDPHWFWLGADYEVNVHEEGSRLLVILRAEHVEGQTLLDVRTALSQLVKERFEAAEVRINAGGEEIGGGLAGHMGGSDRTTAIDALGSHLPCLTPRVGIHPLHPSVIGTWIAQSIVRELVQQKKGKGIMMHAVWLPFETRPHAWRVRNERGEDLNRFVDDKRLDVNRVPETFLASQLITDRVRLGYDGQVRLPWDGEGVV